MFSRKPAILRMDHLHYVVIDFFRDFFEPVRDSGWNDHDVAFREVLCLTTLDFGATLLAWAGDFSAARHHSLVRCGTHRPLRREEASGACHSWLGWPCA